MEIPRSGESRQSDRLNSVQLLCGSRHSGEDNVEIVHFPHPTLRHKSKEIRRVDQELKNIVQEMFQLMYAARGVGLAANQVDLPLRLFIVNTEADPDEGERVIRF